MSGLFEHRCGKICTKPNFLRKNLIESDSVLIHFWKSLKPKEQFTGTSVAKQYR